MLASVLSFTLIALAQLTAAILLAFSLRRAALLLAACWPRTSIAKHPFGTPPHPLTPPLLILIPCRNESASLPGLFDALDRLDYPRDTRSVQVVIVDDGSTDPTASLAQTLIASRPWARLISLPKNVGKPQALN